MGCFCQNPNLCSAGRHVLPVLASSLSLKQIAESDHVFSMMATAPASALLVSEKFGERSASWSRNRLLGDETAEFLSAKILHAPE